MTHTCTGCVLMDCWGGVCQWQKGCKSLKNAMQHCTEAITEYSTHKLRSGSAVLLAYDVRRHQRIHPKVSKIPAAWEHHRSQRNAPALQPSNRDIWRLRHWLHGTILKIPW
jgi:hypothetical protein